MSKKIAKKLWDISLVTDTKSLDEKHSVIVNNAKRIEFSNFCKSFRNWDSQSDSGIPLQLNLYNFKSYGFFKYIKYLISKFKNSLIHKSDEVSYFFDDIEIIKLINGFDILKKCPVHKTPGNNLAYFLNRNISANIRWLRYIYFTAIIRNNINFDKKEQLVLDIGSYYGGFQYVMKKIYKKSNHILVDFPHQLARSAIFLGKSFPDAKIYAIYNNKTFENYFLDQKNKKIDFLLLSTDLYEKFSNTFIKNGGVIDLVTNFYSLGEMPRTSFNSYINSKIINNAKHLYFCNRYDSSPYYESTYQESYSLLDYLRKEYNVILNRSSGIHNYMMPIRKLFGKIKARPISAGYFELIQKK